jgi:hypothetical protein
MLQNYKSNPVAERKSGKKIHFCYNNMNINKIYSLGLRICTWRLRRTRVFI